MVAPRRDRGRQAAADAVLVSFVVTFASTRTITRLIRDGRGPFRNVAVGGTHVHHSVPGIILLMIGAFTAVGGPGTLGWLSFSAVAVGIGTSLVLDEFAMILHLQDVYWSGEGQLSVEAVSLVAACLGLALVGFSPARVRGRRQRRVLAPDQRDRRAGHRRLPGAGLHSQGQVPVGAVRPVPAAGRGHRRGTAGPAQFDLGAAPLSRQAAGARRPPGRGLRPSLETPAGRLAGLHRRPAVAAEPDVQPGAAGTAATGRAQRPRRWCRAPHVQSAAAGSQRLWRRCRPGRDSRPAGPRGADRVRQRFSWLPPPGGRRLVPH